MVKRVLFLSLLAFAAGCSSERRPPPQPAPGPQPRPIATPVPTPAPAPTPAPVGWADLPLTPGVWTYEGTGATSSAFYGPAGSPVFRIQCALPTRSLFLTRNGASPPAAMAVRTSFGARSFPTAPGPESATATLPARDAFLDTMIFSRGRFSVEVAGSPMLVLPSWAEAARVVEDCRR